MRLNIRTGVRMLGIYMAFSDKILCDFLKQEFGESNELTIRISTLAERSGMSYRTVQRGMNRLRAMRVIEYERECLGLPNTYKKGEAWRSN